MAQTIKLKRSATSGATPTTSQLELGEVAINTYDGKMYIKKDVGGTESIVEVGGLSSVALGGLSDVTISSVAADQLLQYNGSEWVNVSIAEASAIMKEYQFTATSGQSTFSGSDDNSETLSYTAGAIQVFLNGIFLDSAVDYTATNGTSIVLSETVDANDYLQVVAFKKKIGDGNVSVDTFTGDDSTTAFTLSLDPGDENNTRVFIDGVYQSKSNYSVSGTTLTFSTAPPTDTAVEVEIGNRVVTLDTLSDLDLPDDVKLRLGTDQDLQIYHDGSNSYIKDTGTGSLAIQASQLNIDSSNGSEYQATFVENGAVSLYYDGSKKFETTNDGVTVTGDVEADEFIGDVRGAVLFKAQAGETLAKGEVVYISGISGNTTIVSKADADDASKMPAFGLVAAAASSGNPVDIYTNGILSGIDTSSYSEGDELFVSTTAGALTATAPTGESAALQKIGKVTRSASSGSIFIVGAGRSNAVPNLDDGDIFIGNASNQAVSASLNTKIESYLDGGTSTPTFAGLATTANMTFGDNDRAIFGAGSDLQIYHDGSNSYIGEFGTGSLRIRSNQIRLEAPDSQNMVIVTEDAGVQAFYNGTQRFQVTNTGIDVTGSVVSDGLTVDGNSSFTGTFEISGASPKIFLNETDTTDVNSRIRSAGGKLQIQTVDNSDANPVTRFEINHSTGDVSIPSGDLDVTGTVTVDGLTVDAALATINAPSNNADLVLTEGGTNTDARIRNSNGILEIDADLNNEFGNSSIMFAVDGTDRLKIDRTGDIEFYEDTGTTPKFHWDAANERLGLGTTTPTQSLDIRSSGSGAAIKLRREDTSDEMLILIGSSYGYVQNTTGPLGLGGSGGDRDLFIATSGNVGINNTNPNFSLDISGADNSQLRLLGTDTNPTTLVMDYNSGGATGRVRIQNDDGDLKFTTNNGNVRQTILENGNVGIGTDSPSQLLNIEGATNPAILVTDTTNTTSLLLRSQNNTSSVGTTSNHPLVLETNGSERMRIDSSGKVGIGTTVPNRSDFNIHGANRTLASTTSQVAITASDSIAADIGGSLHFGARYDTTTTDFAPTGYVAGRRENATVNNYAGYLQFGVTQGNAGTIEAMRITSTGNVGIGTDSPSTKLTVRNDSAGTGHGANNVITIQNANTTDNSRMGLAFTGNTNIGSGLAIIEAQSYDQSLGHTSLNFSVYNGSWHQDMMVLKAGKVGIGTTSPYFPLHVQGANLGNGDAKTTALFFDTTSAAAGTGGGIALGGYTNGTGGDLYHFGNIQGIKENSTAGNYDSAMIFSTRVNGATPTEKLRITSSGNVGIGTSSPSQKLDVAGRIKSNDGLLSNAFQVYNTNSDGFLIQLDISPSDYAHIHGTIKLQQFNVSSQQIIDFSATTLNNGTLQSYAATADIDVTIKLFVYNSSWYIHVPSPSTYTDISAYIHLGQGYQGGSRASNCIVGISATGVPSSGVSGSVDIVAQKRVLANTAGNVGVGETSPNAKFHVKDTLNSTGVAASATPIAILQNEKLNTGSGTAVLRFDTNEVSGTSQFQRATIGAGWDGSGNYRGFLAFATNDSSNTLQERMRIDSSGKVGIGGTVMDGQKLNIEGWTQSDTRTPANAWLIGRGTGGDGLAIGTSNTTPYATWFQSGYLANMGTSNHYALSFNPHGGNVGIGTSSPVSTLHVNGGGYFTQFVNPNGSGVGGLELGYDGTQSVLQSYHRGTSSYKAIHMNAAHVAFKIGGVEKARVHTDGSVGIGTSGPNAPLTIWTASNATSQSALRLNNPGGFSAAGTGAEIIFSQDRNTSEDLRMAAISSRQVSIGSSAHGALSFWTRASSSITEKVRLQHNGILSASAGIALGDGLNYTSANVLDDYEEGTWNAGFTGATVTPTITVGRYTKIGRVVYFSYYSGNSTIASASGQAHITGLPFTIENSIQAYQPFYTSHNTFFGGSTSVGVEGYANAGNTNLIFTNRGTTVSSTFVNGSNKYIMIAGFYLTTA